jgi:hypothetical protein
MFLGSPVPRKKWHLSAQVPQRTQISIKTLKERNLSSLSFRVLYMMSSQFSGKCQSSSAGFQVWGWGIPRPVIVSSLAGKQKEPGLKTGLVSIHEAVGNDQSMLLTSVFASGSFDMATPWRRARRLLRM